MPVSARRGRMLLAVCYMPDRLKDHSETGYDHDPDQVSGHDSPRARVTIKPGGVTNVI